MITFFAPTHFFFLSFFLSFCLLFMPILLLSFYFCYIPIHSLTHNLRCLCFGLFIEGKFFFKHTYRRYGMLVIRASLYSMIYRMIENNEGFGQKMKAEKKEKKQVQKKIEMASNFLTKWNMLNGWMSIH